MKKKVALHNLGCKVNAYEVEAMQQLLEKAGYEIVDDAEDGEEAYGVLQKENIDVLVTDLTMPVLDGIELIRKIREEYRDIYIIVLSCHDDFEYVKEAMRLGADEYVLKNRLDEDSL